MPPTLFIDPTQVDCSQVVADADAIGKFNLHRFEMAHLTAIVRIDPTEQLIVGYKDVGHDEFWVRGHLPGHPLLPGVIQCEAAAQLCSYYIISQKVFDNEFVALSGLDEVRFRYPVRPGDRLIIAAKGVRLNRRLSTFDAQGFVREQLAFQVRVLGSPFDLKNMPS
jgi:3-hydroxyacyl-[acyl-carrier-protein] dehydratase